MPPRKLMRLVPVKFPRRFPEGLKLAPYPEEELVLPEPEIPTLLPPSPPVRRRKIRRRRPIYRAPPERRCMRVPRGCKLNSDSELSPEKSASSGAAPSQADLPKSEAVTPPAEPDQSRPPDLEAVTPQSPPDLEVTPQSPPPGPRRTLPAYFYPPKRVLPQYFYKRDPEAAAKAMADSAAACATRLRKQRLVKEAAEAVASLDRAESLGLKTRRRVGRKKKLLGAANESGYFYHFCLFLCELDTLCDSVLVSNA